MTHDSTSKHLAATTDNMDRKLTPSGANNNTRDRQKKKCSDV